jgi:hypothetical protein
MGQSSQTAQNGWNATLRPAASSGVTHQLTETELGDWMMKNRPAGRLCPAGSGAVTFNVSYRFFVGNHGYYWSWIACAKDSETTDGLGLPGTHGCGAKRLSDNTNYLG